MSEEGLFQTVIFRWQGTKKAPNLCCCCHVTTLYSHFPQQLVETMFDLKKTGILGDTKIVNLFLRSKFSGGSDVVVVLSKLILDGSRVSIMNIKYHHNTFVNCLSDQ